MKFTPLAALLCLASLPGLAETWHGALVDSRCYDAEERNRNPWAPLSYTARDWEMEVRFCRPNQHTKKFALVEMEDGTPLYFDAAGNARAEDLVRPGIHVRILPVEVSGQLEKDTIEVDSISSGVRGTSDRSTGQPDRH